jgi:hypothetical protein
VQAGDEVIVRKQEQGAIEVLARYFSATWEQGEEPPDAYLTMAGKRIAVDVVSVRQRVAARDGRAKPRLRLDRVALRFVESLQASLREAVPDGNTLILTITAPIRLPNKTAAALEDKIRRRRARPELRHTINGNQIRVRFVRGGLQRAARVIGFVHSADSDPVVLLEFTQSLLARVGAGRRAPARFTGHRWLVILDEGGVSHVETYRHLCSQLSKPNDFKKIVAVLAGGRIESLSG